MNKIYRMKNKKIRILMLEKNVKAKELSRLTGIKYTTLLRQLNEVDLLEVPRKIAKALDVELKDIVE